MDAPDDYSAVYEKLAGAKTADEVKSILADNGCKLSHEGAPPGDKPDIAVAIEAEPPKKKPSFGDMKDKVAEKLMPDEAAGA